MYLNKYVCTWLQPTNVVQVAKCLLKMSKEDFRLEHQKQALNAISSLEETLSHYLFPSQGNHYSKYSPVEESEYILKNLMEQTRYLLALLMPERRVELATVNTAKSHELCE